MILTTAYKTFVIEKSGKVIQPRISINYFDFYKKKLDPFGLTYQLLRKLEAEGEQNEKNFILHLN